MKQASTWSQINALENSLIVSCQADEGEPLATQECIKAMSLSAITGGAKGIRLEGVENIQYVRKYTKLPIIGLIKSKEVNHASRAGAVYITATTQDAASIAQAGADIIAIDATGRTRPDGTNLKEMIELIHNKLGKPVWADIATTEEARLAQELKADVISTTLYGYTQESLASEDTPPNFELLSQISQLSAVPVVLEGRVWQPTEITQAFESGAWSVVVGSAITRPQLITRRFVNAIPTPSKSL